MADTLRGLMTHHHARQEIAALIDKYGDDFVILTAQSISIERRRKAYDAYVKERDAARAAFSSHSQGTRDA